MFICCVCLTFDELLYPIIQDHVTLFEECTSIRANQTDFLCPKCIERLKLAYEFRIEALNGYQELQKRLLEAKEIVKDEPIETEILDIDDQRSVINESLIEREEEKQGELENENDLKKEEAIIEYVVYETENIDDSEILETQNEDYDSDHLVIHDESEDILESVEDFVEVEEEYLIENFDDQYSEKLSFEKSVITSKTQTKQKTAPLSLKSIRAKQAWTEDAKKFLIKHCPYCFFYDKSKAIMMTHVQEHIGEF